MKKGRYILLPILLVVFIIIVLVLMLMAFLTYQKTYTPELQQSTAVQETVEQNPDSIAIPGYEGLELQANTKQQTIALSNPAQNMCYFQIELYLEDGTLLWQSELIEPGETSKPIYLQEKLEAGTYSNAILLYSCFKMDEELTPLNGAETKLTLWVK